MPLARAGTLLAVATLSLAGALAAPRAADAAITLHRTFLCSAGLGEAFTQRAVTGELTNTARPVAVTVTRTANGTVDSYRAKAATLVGPSVLHPGYTEWNVTGPNPNGDTFHLSIPPVLPGAGGFFDADLDIEFAGGANGGWQIPMFDCTVSGGPASLSTPYGSRTFSCTGSAGEAFTTRTVAGSLTRQNQPLTVTVSDAGGAPVDHLNKRARLVGASRLHTGYTQWDITGPTSNPDLYYLHVPPVLPKPGGFFDADLEIEFAGGANGNWQIPMFDCTVSP
jgi:hypothetical protein